MQEKHTLRRAAAAEQRGDSGQPRPRRPSIDEYGDDASESPDPIVSWPRVERPLGPPRSGALSAAHERDSDAGSSARAMSGVTTVAPLSRPTPTSTSTSRRRRPMAAPLAAPQRAAGPGSEARAGARAARRAAPRESGAPLSGPSLGSAGPSPGPGPSPSPSPSPHSPTSPSYRGKGGGAAAQRGTASSRPAPCC